MGTHCKGQYKLTNRDEELLLRQTSWYLWQTVVYVATSNGEQTNRSKKGSSSCQNVNKIREISKQKFTEFIQRQNVSYIYTVSQKTSHFVTVHYLRQILTKWQFYKFFHWHILYTMCNKTVKNQPHLKCVATLPCEIQMLKNHYDRNKLNVCAHSDENSRKTSLKFAPSAVQWQPDTDPQGSLGRSPSPVEDLGSQYFPTLHELCPAEHDTTHTGRELVQKLKWCI